MADDLAKMQRDSYLSHRFAEHVFNAESGCGPLVDLARNFDPGATVELKGFGNSPHVTFSDGSSWLILPAGPPLPDVGRPKFNPHDQSPKEIVTILRAYDPGVVIRIDERDGQLWINIKYSDEAAETSMMWLIPRWHREFWDAAIAGEQ
jgi:hypothetical protein